MCQEPHLYCQIVSKQAVWTLSASEGMHHSPNHISLFHVLFSTMLQFYSDGMLSELNFVYPFILSWIEDLIKELVKMRFEMLVNLTL